MTIKLDPGVVLEFSAESFTDCYKGHVNVIKGLVELKPRVTHEVLARLFEKASYVNSIHFKCISDCLV